MKNKKILIIGGTGALGKTLLKRYYDNNEVIVFSRDEHKHYHLLKEYKDIVSVIGDVKDKDSVMNVLLQYNPHVVINTAALKHVPICEDNPYESVKTNIIGHQNVIECVNTYGKVESLIFVSTDKACKPINVYGMSKAISEQLYVSYAKKQLNTKVVLVRYGNVLESTGSVIPYFKDLLKDSKTTYLPITHSEMTRFLLTLEQAIDLIEWAYNNPNSHGKIAIPKIESLNIVDLAKAIAKSCGKKDMKFHKIPIRDGEKLHEEMISEIEFQRTEEFDDYYLIGYDKTNESYNHKPFNSQYHVTNDVEEFLKKNNIII